MSIKNDILNALRDELLTISDVIGYNTTVKDVTRSVKDYVKHPEMTPAIWILENGEDLIIEDSTHKRYLLRCSLFCEILTGDPIETMTGLDADIKVLFERGLILTAYAMASRIVSTASFVASEDGHQGYFQMEIEIIYYAEKAI